MSSFSAGFAVEWQHTRFFTSNNGAHSGLIGIVMIYYGQEWEESTGYYYNMPKQHYLYI